MTWIVQWQGREYDVDPAEFSAGELKLVKERTGMTYAKLMEAVASEQDGEAICALFWIVDRRQAPDLKFSDYQGPPLKVVLASLDGLNTAMEELGKAMGIDETGTRTTPTDGGPTSPSSTPSSQTEPSTTG